MAIVQAEQPPEAIVWRSYGGTLQAMRRWQLWRLADLHGMEYPSLASKEDMLKIVDAWQMKHGVDPLMTPPNVSRGAPRDLPLDVFLKAVEGNPEAKKEAKMVKSGTRAQDFAEQIEGVSPFVTEEPEQPDGLDGMGFIELKQLAKSKNLPQRRDMNADQLRALIRGQDAT